MTVLLARTADRLLWGARYLERSEDTARVVRAYSDLVFDYSDEMLSWEPLAALTGSDKYADSSPDERGYTIPADDFGGERTVIHYMLGDRLNPSSVVSSVTAARANLRTTREVLPREAWQAANHLSQYCDGAVVGAVERGVRDRFLARVIEVCRRLDGVLDSTMTRGHAYYMLRLGRLLERADMTTRVLGVAAANALHNERFRRESGAREDIVIDEVQWMSVLRSVAALQMYQRATRGPIEGLAVVNFLMTHAAFPRSVQGCLDEIRFLLAALPNSGGPLELLAAAEGLLAQTGHDVTEGASLDREMERVQAAIAEVSEEIYRTYVGGALAAAPNQSQSQGGAGQLPGGGDA
ncbi:MAG TPA: alpha-E domain-containing protein [Ilumatobacter sp.]|nr:alpha-E domain-containing protein [Ilumatobacter sp.]